MELAKHKLFDDLTRAAKLYLQSPEDELAAKRFSNILKQVQSETKMVPVEVLSFNVIKEDKTSRFFAPQSGPMRARVLGELITFVGALEEINAFAVQELITFILDNNIEADTESLTSYLLNNVGSKLELKLY